MDSNLGYRSASDWGSTSDYRSVWGSDSNSDCNLALRSELRSGKPTRTESEQELLRERARKY